MADHPDLHNQEEKWSCRSAPCPVCEGGEFAWGSVDAYHGSGMQFIPKDSSFLKRLGGFEKILEITHRACYGCGAIQMFLKQPLPVPKEQT
ncbi:hypothetical protein [Blastopirellula marina]|nr:hypothetical protein [Blastopirellula marina]